MEQSLKGRDVENRGVVSLTATVLTVTHTVSPEALEHMLARGKRSKDNYQSGAE